MKKTAVVTASIVLFVILIGVNYLLWDNSSKKQDIESLENKEETSQQSFQDLWDDYKDTNKENTDLKTQIIDLEKTISEKDNEIELLKTENMNRYVLVGDKNTIIYQLKKHVDTEYFQSLLDEWVADINDKAYFAAYLLHNEKDIFNNRSDIMLGRYGEKYENIDFMEVTDFEVRVIDSEDSLDQDAKNRLAFDVLMNIELVKDEEGYPADDAIFNNGLNHFKVTMSFDMVSWKWFIWTIE
ncbi:MAG: hypothetical protein J7L77_03850 [Clostridiales bacterium]|nr:hypothetical protein [Clostridiales bacterium]